MIQPNCVAPGPRPELPEKRGFPSARAVAAEVQSRRKNLAIQVRRSEPRLSHDFGDPGMPPLGVKQVEYLPHAPDNVRVVAGIIHQNPVQR